MFERNLCLFWMKELWIKLQEKFRLWYLNGNPLRKENSTIVQIVVRFSRETRWKPVTTKELSKQTASVCFQKPRTLGSRFVQFFGTCIEEHRGDLRKKTCFAAGKLWICHCAAVLYTQVPKKCIDLDLTLLYIMIKGTHSTLARKDTFLALGVCFLQTCSSAGACLPRQDHD